MNEVPVSHQNIQNAQTVGESFTPKTNQDEHVKKEVRAFIRGATQWQELKRDCTTAEEWETLKEQILLAPNLTSKEKQLIIHTP